MTKLPTQYETSDPLHREAERLAASDDPKVSKAYFERWIEENFPEAETEQAVLDQIQNWAPKSLLRRYYRLSVKFRHDRITDPEYVRLLVLSERIEMLQVKRLENLIALSKLRNITLQELVSQPEFGPKPWSKLIC